MSLWSLQEAKKYTNNKVSERLFSPIDISDLALWLDASDKTTIITRLENDNEYVTEWLDKSGHNNVAVNAGFKQPVTNHETLNERNVITFNGIDSHLTVWNLPLQEPTTIVAVYKQNTIVYGGNYVFDGVDVDNRYGLAMCANSSYGDRFMAINGASGKIAYGGIIDITPQIVSVTFNGRPGSNARLNGSIAPWAYNSLATDAQTNGLRIGSRYSMTNSLDGYIAEIIVIERELTSEEYIFLHKYLEDKWGISCNYGPMSKYFGGLTNIGEDVTAVCAYSYDVNTGMPLYQQNPLSPIRARSTIKLLTAVTVTENISDFSEVVEIVDGDNIGVGSTAQLQIGDNITINDLLYGALLPSGNDAAKTLARVVGQKLLDAEENTTDSPYDRFYQEMNSVASRLGANEIVAFDASGVESANTKLSAKSLCILMKRASEIQLLRTILSTKIYTMTITGPNARTYNITSTNILLNDADYNVLGGKTGSGAGYNNFVVLWSPNEGVEIVIAVLGSNSEPERFTDARKIMAKTLLDYEWVDNIPRLKR